MTPKSRWLALLPVLGIAAVVFAQNDPPPQNPAVQEFTRKADAALLGLEKPKTHLAQPAYAEEDHEAASKALADLTALVEPIKAKVPEVAAALADASAEEGSFWTRAPSLVSKPDQFNSGAAQLKAKLEVAVTGVNALLGRGADGGAGGPTAAQKRLKGILVDPFEHRTANDLGAGNAGGSGVTGTGGGGNPNALVNSAGGPKGLHVNDIPGSPGTAVDSSVPPAKGSLAWLQAQDAMYAAAEPLWPINRATVRERATVGREWREVQAVQAGREWVVAHADELKTSGKDPQKLLSEIDAALAKPAAQRQAALLAIETKLNTAMAGSKMGQADAQLREKLAKVDGQLSQADSAQLLAMIQAMKESDPTYFKARGMWAQYVEFNRKYLKMYPNGTAFKGEELGLPPPQDQAIVVRMLQFGVSGLATTTNDGLKHFVGDDGSSADEQVMKDEKGKEFRGWVRRRRVGETLIVSTYDSNLKLIASMVTEQRRDGTVVIHPEGKDKPRQTGRMVDGKFVLEKLENEDGSGRELAGKDAPGAWIIKGAGGRLDGWLLDSSKLGAGSQAEKNAAADKIARWAVSKGFAASGSGATDDYRARSVSSFLRDYFRLRKGGDDTTIYLDRIDTKVAVTQTMQGGGVHQVIAKFEPTYSGWDVGKGLPKEGLSLYVRSARSADDQQSQFTRITQYLADWGREVASMTTDSNVDAWYSWITGPKVTETQKTHREYWTDDGKGGWYWRADTSHFALGEPKTIFDGPGIIGATGHALNVVGTGVVDLAGSAAAITFAGGAKLVGADDAADDFAARAKVNFFNNAISSELGENYIGDSYTRGKDSMHLDKSKYIQNVRQEMTDQGHPIVGAVLGGGIKFADSVAPLLMMGGALEGVAQLGNTGRLAASLTGYYMGGKAVVDLGQSSYHFAVAAIDYHTNPNDPVAQKNFYDNIEEFTTQALYAPMTLSVVGQVRNAIKGKAPGAEPGGEKKGALTELANTEIPVGDRKLNLDFMKKLVPDAVARADAKLPELIRGANGGRARNILADNLGMPKVPGEKGPGAGPEGGKNEGGKAEETIIPDNDGMKANREKMEALEKRYQKVREKVNGNEKLVDSDLLVAGLDQGVNLPPLDPKIKDPALVAQRNAQVGEFAKKYLGIEGEVTVKGPDTPPLSGAEVFLVRNAKGEVVAVYKVFPKSGELVRELGGVSQVNGMGDNPGMNLQNSRGAAHPYGAWQLEGGKVGYMMEGAPGRDVYEAIKELKGTEGSGRETGLKSLEGDMKAVAGSMAELHGVNQEGPITMGRKQEIIKGASENLDALLKPDPKGKVAREWTIDQALYDKLDAKLKADAARFEAADMNGTVTHGDAHPGNFFVTKNGGKVTMIDIETIMESMDVEFKGKNPAAMDVARFQESIRLNNAVKKLGLDVSEIPRLEKAFADSYFEQSGLPAAKRADFDAAVEFYRTKMQITALKYAETHERFKDFAREILGENTAPKVEVKPTPKPETGGNTVPAKTGGEAKAFPADMGKAEQVLGRKPTAQEAQAIEDAHQVGAGEPGKDGTPAKAGNYTQAQIRAKNEILNKAGLDSNQIRGLMEAGVVGIPELPPMEWIDRLSKVDKATAEKYGGNAAVFKNWARETLRGMKAEGGKSGYSGRSTAQIEAAQAQYKNSLKPQVLEAVRRAGLDPSQVITHGTDLQGLVGMLMVGEMRPTARQAGESAKLWGGNGVDVGVGYATTTGMKNGRPGVTIIMNNPTLKVVYGETLNRVPTVEGDFVAAVVTDGTRSIILDKNALNALGGSAKTWKELAVSKARSGSMGEFDQWESLETKIVPQ